MYVVTLLIITLFVHSNLFASTQTGTVEVIEVIEHNDNPILLFVKNWSEGQIRILEHQKEIAHHNRDNDASKIAIAKIRGMKSFQKDLNSKIGKDLIEIRAWDGENSKPIILFCQTNETRDVARRAKSGNLLLYIAEDDGQSVEVRAGREIKWRRGKKDGEVTYLPFPQDDVSWHWSVDGWEKEWTTRTEKLVQALEDRSIKYMQVDSGYSNLFVFTLPKYWNVVELDRAPNRPYHWKMSPLIPNYPWETVVDNSLDVSVSVEPCEIDGKTINCLQVTGNVDEVYSIKVSVYEADANGELGKKVTPREGLVIGGMSGGHFGESLDKELLTSIEFSEMNPRVIEYIVEIEEIAIRKTQ